MEKHYYHGEITNFYGCEQETLTIEVRANPREGRKYLIELVPWFGKEGRDGHGDISVMGPDNARSLVGHLYNAIEIAEHMEGEQTAGIDSGRMLPTILLCGSVFYIDERLKQLRNVDNPDHCFDLEDPMK